MHRILIVDDHPTIRKVLRSLFESNGFEVCGEAINGVDGIEKARELRPDLVLLDLSMPVMDGLAAARQLNELMPEVRLMMLTNHADSILETDALNVGIRRLILKDRASDMLIAAAQEILRLILSHCLIFFLDCVFRVRFYHHVNLRTRLQSHGVTIRISQGILNPYFTVQVVGLFDIDLCFFGLGRIYGLMIFSTVPLRLVLGLSVTPSLTNGFNVIAGRGKSIQYVLYRTVRPIREILACGSPRRRPDTAIVRQGTGDVGRRPATNIYARRAESRIA